jgi:hypothetical protein
MNDGPANDHEHTDGRAAEHEAAGKHGAGKRAAGKQAAGQDDAALEELRREFGDRWGIARMTGGYRATPRGTGGTPIPRYGTTPDELADSIRRVERG